VHRDVRTGSLLDNGIVIKTHSLCDGCYAKDLKSNFNVVSNPGLCLNPSPGSFADKVQCGAAAEQRRSRRKGGNRGPALECCEDSKPYHRAIVLVRHPLDVVKSNFHFRLTSLGMHSEFNYQFVTDRIDAWIQLYNRCVENLRLHAITDSRLLGTH